MYLYLKIIHIFSFVSWFVMLFYLPRLFIYHVENISNKSFCEIVKIQESRLFNYIGYPAMIFTLLTGGGMIAMEPSLLKGGGWLHAKIFMVVLLIIYHFSLYHYMISLKKEKNVKSSRFFRILNELPTLVLLIIVSLVILKSF